MWGKEEKRGCSSERSCEELWIEMLWIGKQSVGRRIRRCKGVLINTFMVFESGSSLWFSGNISKGFEYFEITVDCGTLFLDWLQPYSETKLSALVNKGYPGLWIGFPCSYPSYVVLWLHQLAFCETVSTGHLFKQI